MALPIDRESLHFEPFIHLAGLDDDQALIAWGGFWFTRFSDGRGMRIIDDEELAHIDRGRHESIGARSSPYGHAVVTAYGPDGREAARAETTEDNHVWLRGLEPDTLYEYRVEVDGQVWGEGERMSWHRLGPDRGELRPAGRGYDLRFRTFPDRTSDAGVTFVAFGDYGVGIQASDESGRRQLDLARAMSRAIEHHDVRLIVTLGDNIYHREGEAVGGSGKEDDDWYFSYYEPYRWLISQVPVYPAVGNHDASETEHSDDRGQLDDNHFLELRFVPKVEEGRASLEPGLFYRVDYSRLVQFVCIDTSKSDQLEADRFFLDRRHMQFVEESLEQGEGHRWRIPFCHHPPFCAGPSHQNDVDMIEHLVPRFERAGVRLVLSGHEHNFQYARYRGVHYIVSGAAGKLRPERPERFEEAHTAAWSATPHFLMIQLEGPRCTIWPLRDIDEDGTLRQLEAETPDGRSFELPIELRHDDLTR